MFLIPSTLKTSVAELFSKICFEMFRNIPHSYADISIYLPFLPFLYPILMLITELTLIGAKFDLMTLLKSGSAIDTHYHQLSIPWYTYRHGMNKSTPEPERGLEPPIFRLQSDCSTIELLRRVLTIQETRGL